MYLHALNDGNFKHWKLFNEIKFYRIINYQLKGSEIEFRAMITE